MVVRPLKHQPSVVPFFKDSGRLSPRDEASQGVHQMSKRVCKVDIVFVVVLVGWRGLGVTTVAANVASIESRMMNERISVQAKIKTKIWIILLELRFF
jgi:septin family protein